MDVEFTARHLKVSKALRTQAEEGMERIGRFLGKSAHASLIFTAQRHVRNVELTVKARTQKFVATGEGTTLDVALRQAIERAESQVLRYRDRRLVKKRLPTKEKVLTAPPVARPKARAANPAVEDAEAKPARAAKTQTTIPVHSFPARATVVEPHIVKNGEAIALSPMTIEQAVKEAEFRDRDLLIFRTISGELYVLHRRRDGQMELVEIP